VRQFFPEAVDDIDPADVYADLPTVAGRPSVRLNMIASADGSATLGAVSGGLGGPADKRVFAVLRSLADVVLVGAGTVRAEHYGPAAVPVAVVTRSCHLDWQSPFFTAPIARPIVVTVSDAPDDNRARAADVADVIVAGGAAVDVAEAVRLLGERGLGRVLAEGGPSLNGDLVQARVLDELCLTVSPRVVGGDGRRIVAGPAPPAPTGLRLRTVCEEDSFLFLRFTTADEEAPPNPAS
jgi:riboflavin biosynthesis pyrimidine reductase